MAPVISPGARPRLSRFSERLGYRGVSLSIASASLLAGIAFSFWQPFLPLYLLDLGAPSEANALFWVGIAYTGQGLTRFIASPLWGVLSDRLGRKLMFVRALAFAGLTTLLVALLQEPWQITIALVCQGIFSGFNPAATALASVSVPDSHLHQSLRWVNGTQYISSIIGPAIGASLAVALGFRGAILLGATLPVIAAAWVVLVVPRDRVSPRPPRDTVVRSKRDAWKTFPPQFYLAWFAFFVLFTLPMTLRLVTPVVLKDVEGSGATAASGLVFTISGIASVAGVFFVSGRYMRPGRMRYSLVVACLIAAVADLLLVLTDVVPAHLAWYVIWFSVAALMQGAMLPATNTLLAATVGRDRRGTAFGFAGSAIALALIVGPIAGAALVAIHFDLVFVAAGVILVALATLLFFAMREPELESPPAAPAS